MEKRSLSVFLGLRYHADTSRSNIHAFSNGCRFFEVMSFYSFRRTNSWSLNPRKFPVDGLLTCLETETSKLVRMVIIHDSGLILLVCTLFPFVSGFTSFCTVSNQKNGVRKQGPSGENWSQSAVAWAPHRDWCMTPSTVNISGSHTCGNWRGIKVGIWVTEPWRDGFSRQRCQICRLASELSPQTLPRHRKGKVHIYWM